MMLVKLPAHSAGTVPVSLLLDRSRLCRPGISAQAGDRGPVIEVDERLMLTMRDVRGSQVMPVQLQAGVPSSCQPTPLRRGSTLLRLVLLAAASRIGPSPSAQWCR